MGVLCITTSKYLDVEPTHRWNAFDEFDENIQQQPAECMPFTKEQGLEGRFRPIKHPATLAQFCNV